MPTPRPSTKNMRRPEAGDAGLPPGFVRPEEFAARIGVAPGPGLLGLSGISNDCRVIEEGVAAGDPACKRAMDVFVYRIVKRDGLFVFQREEVEVVPAGYREGDAVSARFHTIRRIFIKRLETAILDEYVVSPVPISTISPTPTDERRGALIPVNITAKEGWLEVELKFDPNYVK